MSGTWSTGGQFCLRSLFISCSSAVSPVRLLFRVGALSATLAGRWPPVRPSGVYRRCPQATALRLSDRRGAATGFRSTAVPCRPLAQAADRPRLEPRLA